MQKIGFVLRFGTAQLGVQRKRVVFNVTLPNNPAEIERLLEKACKMEMQDRLIALRDTPEKSFEAIDKAIEQLKDFGWEVSKEVTCL